MILQIDGWWGSGKSVLKGLLDGHSEVFSSPVHDIVLMSFKNENSDAQWLKYKDTEQLRKLLASVGRYYRIERFTNNGKVHYDFSKTDRVYMPFKFDFFEFDKRVFIELHKIEIWSIEIIVETIYKQLDLALGGTGKRIYYAAMGEPYHEQLDKYKTHYPDGKFIYIDRSPESIIATRSGRKPIKEDFRSSKGYANEAWDLINRNEVENILAYRNKVEQLAQQNPMNFLMVPFDDLVVRTHETTKVVSSFLDIKSANILNVFTHLGDEVVCNGKRYIGEEHDRPEDILTKDELEEIHKRKQNFYLSQFIPKNNKKTIFNKRNALVNKAMYLLGKLKK